MPQKAQCLAFQKHTVELLLCNVSEQSHQWPTKSCCGLTTSVQNKKVIFIPVMKPRMEQNGMEPIGAHAKLKIVLNRLCTVSNFHTITIIVLKLVCFCLVIGILEIVHSKFLLNARHMACCV